MRKKLQKKLNILNRNIHIKNYSNYLIYSYLNNYNLKLFFYYLNKKNYYIKNLKNFNSQIKLCSFNNLKLKNNTYLNYNFKSYNNLKNKFFTSSQMTQSYMVNINTSISLNSEYFLNNGYIIDSNDFNQNLTINIYKELVTLNFIISLSKIWELYKIIIMLFYVIKNK